MKKFLGIVPREKIYEITGIQFLPFNTLFQIHAQSLENPGLLESASDLLFLPDLFAYFLTGPANERGDDRLDLPAFGSADADLEPGASRRARPRTQTLKKSDSGRDRARPPSGRRLPRKPDVRPFRRRHGRP